ncbi:hypothetical protein AFE_2647 [Acidithiobacillus ferrooxidans ATCC 23270]|uniref:Uncharacterized protein n=1 Tax=Acidithiobacillus ferrooxidans (strain ATCC 23270 / DSM 14882 / CIP 104768 / NCIMB 8455) TaxID=243159 RepID=B7J7W1_ACIF2|nr:hypothetical protein AFE_2647 [Acidithiobacillus ferrooxidans ATCC 23270]
MGIFKIRGLPKTLAAPWLWELVGIHHTPAGVRGGSKQPEQGYV